MKTRILMFILLLPFLVISAFANPQKIKITAEYYPQFQQTGVNKRVFVFVHGLFGDAYETWKNDNGSYFFDLLKKDMSDEIKKSDVFVFGYPSGFAGKTSYSIEEAANTLATYMRQKKVIDYNEIYFVAHSMGGLVTLTYLLRNPDVAQKVPIAFLYSTPFSGSDIAKTGSFFSKNPGLTELHPHDGVNEINYYLASLSERWKDSVFNKRISTVIRCAYEKEPVFGNLIVSKESATNICQGVSYPIPENHINIFKKPGYDSVSYVALKDALSLHNKISRLKKERLLRDYPLGYTIFEIDQSNSVFPYSSRDILDQYEIDWTPVGIVENQNNMISLRLPDVKFKNKKGGLTNVTTGGPKKIGYLGGGVLGDLSFWGEILDINANGVTFLVGFNALPEAPLTGNNIVTSETAIIDWKREQINLRNQANNLLLSGNFKELEKIANNLREEKIKYPNGSLKLGIFYTGLIKPVNKEELSWTSHFDQLEKWKKLFPNSVTAQVALGSAWSFYGFYALEKDLPTVNSEMKLKLHRERMEKAYNVLIEKNSKLIDCKFRYVSLLVVGQELRWDKERYESVFKQAVAFDPMYHNYYFQMAEYLCSYYHEKVTNLPAILDEVLKFAPKSKEMTLYTSVAIRMRKRGIWDGSFTNNLISWDKMKNGFREFDKSDPQSSWTVNRFALFACLAKDRETVLELTKRIGNHPIHEAWEDISYEKCCEWAVSE